MGSISGGTDFGQKTLSVYNDPISNVISTGFDLAVATSADKILPTRVNGLNVAGTYFAAGAGPGSGTFTSQPLYIGARAGTSLYLNGRIYSLIVRGAATSETQIGQTEQWISNEMGGGYVP
jgi:hypothetical protein